MNINIHFIHINIHEYKIFILKDMNIKIFCDKKIFCGLFEPMKLYYIHYIMISMKLMKSYHYMNPFIYLLTLEKLMIGVFFLSLHQHFLYFTNFNSCYRNICSRNV